MKGVGDFGIPPGIWANRPWREQVLTVMEQFVVAEAKRTNEDGLLCGPSADRLDAVDNIITVIDRVFGITKEHPTAEEGPAVLRVIPRGGLTPEHEQVIAEMRAAFGFPAEAK